MAQLAIPHEVVVKIAAGTTVIQGLSWGWRMHLQGVTRVAGDWTLSTGRKSQPLYMGSGYLSLLTTRQLEGERDRT